ncbi:Polarized growth protein Scy OS=Streptomyces alboniger OX=132473 GN=CP975_24655 PE=4 SV=1 [Streptomyces alboniger]
MVGAARAEADRLSVRVRRSRANALVERARTDADELLVGARRDATADQGAAPEELRRNAHHGRDREPARAGPP